MIDRTQELKIAIYRNEPKLEWSLHDVDTGSLFQQLTLPPYQLIERVRRGQGSIRLEAQRTKEWELVLDLALAGSQAFLAGALSALGKRFAGWLAEHALKTGKRRHAAVRTAEGREVIVESSELAQAERAIVQILEEAIENGSRIELIVECGQ